MKLERCKNCNRDIGNLEPACVWEERVVCKRCHAKLSDAHPTPVLAKRSPKPILLTPEDVVMEEAPNRLADQVLMYATPADDPLQQLAAAQRATPVYPSQSSQMHVHYHQAMYPPQRRGMHPLARSGLILMLSAIPFVCIFFPIAILLFAVGFVLLIIGSCL